MPGTSRDGLEMNRRGFLGAAAGGVGVALALPGAARVAAREARRAAAGRAKNVIFLVSDGMSTGTLTLADMASVANTGRRSAWVELWTRPGVHRAMASTHAADSLVTDSAAAGCAWSIGEHVNNGAVNFTPDGRTPTPLLVHARQCGKATGLVTTTRVTHATPASFVASVPSRDEERAISRQVLERRVDVVLGGGGRYFTEEALSGRPDLKVVRSAAELRSAPLDGPLLGAFASSHMAFELDRPVEQPDLETMTRAALARLSRHSDGFVLQVEGGRVDHAGHSNDAAAIVADQLAFDRALAAALDFALERDDTLVITTSDHGNANPGLTFYGEDGRKGFERLLGARRSFEWIEGRVGKPGPETEGAFLAAVREAAQVELSESDVASLRSALARRRTSPFIGHNNLTSALGQVLANHFGVAFMSPHHTSDMVEVTAVGPGSEALRPWIDIIELHGLVVGALALAPARAIDR